MKRIIFLSVTALLFQCSFAQTNIFPSSGNVGIGTTSPTAKLEVFGAAGALQFLVQPSSTGNAFAKIASNGNGHAYLNIDANYSCFIDFLSAGTSKWQIGRPSGTYDFEIYNSNLSNTVFLIQSTTGNVGIGTTNPGNYKLAVEGTIGARKIKITQSSWADYVFEDNYKLPSLAEVEQYIKEHKHLPDVPTANEVKEQGADVGDTQVLLLKKIEELTLYLIEQNKKMEEMQKEINQLKTARQ